MQDIILLNNSQDEHLLTLVFLNNSRAMGALLLFYSYLNKTQLMFITLAKEKSKEYKLPSSMLKDSLIVYDIEQDGRLLPGINYPAKSQIVNEVMNKLGEFIITIIIRSGNNCSS